MDTPIVAVIAFLLFNLLFIGGIFYLARASCRKAKIQFPWWGLASTVFLILLVKLVSSEGGAGKVQPPPRAPPAMQRASSFQTDEEIIEEAVRNGELPAHAFRRLVRG